MALENLPPLQLASLSTPLTPSKMQISRELQELLGDGRDTRWKEPGSLNNQVEAYPLIAPLSIKDTCRSIKITPKLCGLKKKNYYLIASVGQEFRSSLAGWF